MFVNPESRVGPSDTNSEKASFERIIKDAESADSFGIPSGLAALDRVTRGWQRSSLVLVAGAASMGCTSLLVTAMRNAVTDFGRSVAYFSLQMSRERLLSKWVCLDLEVSLDVLNSGKMADSKWAIANDFQSIWARSADQLFRVDDSPAPTIGHIAAECRRLRAEGVELFLIDNLQRITLGKEARAFCSNREQEIAYIIRRLKTLARELDVAMVVAAELSRPGSDWTRRPRLSDLRDSGAVEYEADLVLLLYRPEYYGILEDDYALPTQNKAELIVAKNTFGPTETASLEFLTECGKFMDHADYGFNSATAAPFPGRDYKGPPFDDPFPPLPNPIRLGHKISDTLPNHLPPSN